MQRQALRGATQVGYSVRLMKDRLTVSRCLPEDHERAVLVGRVFVAALEGPVLVRVQADGVYDLSAVAATSSQLLNRDNPAAAIRAAGTLPRLASTADVLANSAHDARDPALPWLLAPCDLQALKASGVTFVASTLERVIEEQARGDAAKAEVSAPRNRRGDRRQPGEDPSGIAGGRTGQGDADPARRLVAISRSGHRARCRNLHQVAADVRGGTGCGSRHPSEIGVEQSGAGNRAGGQAARAARSAQRSATTSICATSKAAAHSCWARRRTTMRRARSARSSASSTRTSASTTSAAANSRCASTGPRASR